MLVSALFEGVEESIIGDEIALCGTNSAYTSKLNVNFLTQEVLRNSQALTIQKHM